MRKKCPSMKEGRNIGWKETGLRGGRVVMKRNERREFRQTIGLHAQESVKKERKKNVSVHERERILYEQNGFELSFSQQRLLKHNNYTKAIFSKYNHPVFNSTPSDPFFLTTKNCPFFAVKCGPCNSLLLFLFLLMCSYSYFHF